MDILRAALYIRVSSEEQVREGYSLDAQRENLIRYAKSKGYSIVDIYADEGITARKKYTNRKEFMRLLSDVEDGKIDIILFIKLDRWFRNVADYYKIQEILDRNSVNWSTTTESYDTTNANGRLYINIRLAVAQDESDRTSERIKFVFEKKVLDSEVIWGTPPLGYRIENKRIVIDEKEEDFVKLIFSSYFKLRSVNAVCTELNKLRDRPFSYNVYSKILKHNVEFYAGIYRANNNYAPPYITKEELKEIKSINDSNFKPARNGGKTYDYIFAGLLKCGNCGRSITGAGYNTKLDSSKTYFYRCCGHRGNLCSHGNFRVSEKKLEKKLFAVLEEEITKYKVEYEINKVKPKRTNIVTAASVNKKMARLRQLYINELIEIEDYKKEYEELQEQLAKIESDKPEPEKDFTSLEKMLDRDFKSIYKTLSNLDKRSLWHSVIKEIVILDHEIKEIKFK